MINFTPEKLSKQHIWDIVEDFRSQHPFAQNFPVKIEELIEFNLGIEIVVLKNLKLLVDVEAFLSKDLRKIFIDSRGYDNNSYIPRHRFTLAEEVGHFVLHKKIYQQGVTYTSEEEFINDILNMDQDDLDWVEYQARQFAGRLLVPLNELEDLIKKNKRLIDEFYQRYYGTDDVKEFVIEGMSKKICNVFEVSFSVIKYRIYHENLEHYFLR